MKALLLIFAAVLLVGCGGMASAAEETRSPSLPWYYNSPCQQPEGVGLHDWLANLEQHSELVNHSWDCSQTSAYIEWLVENCGHEAKIACRLPTDIAVGHCWVTVKGNPYEATHLHWIDHDVVADVEFADIYEAWAYTKYNKLGEWGWWISHPELRP